MPMANDEGTTVMIESTMLWNKMSTKPSESNVPVRFLRRQWKHNKPHLQKSTSTPTLSILPTSRPHFTCQQCGFTNTQIPMCLWCCWTSKDAETAFEKSMPRARRVSAPMRVQGLVNGRDKKRAKNGRVIDATDVSVMCRGDRSSINGQDRGARWLGHTNDRPGFCGTEFTEPTAWSTIRLATGGGPRSGLSGDEVNHVPTWASPGLQATDKRISSSRDAIGGVVCETDPRQRRREWGRGRDMGDGANPLRKEKSRKPEPEPMSSMQSSVTPARKSGMKTIGGVSDSDSVLITMPTPKTKGRSLLPLRLRRLKGAVTPLFIDSTTQPSLTSVINSTSPVTNDTAITATTATSAMPSPRTLRRKSHLKIFRTDSAQGGSSDVASSIRAMTNAEPGPSSTRRPKSDPFGEVLRMQHRAGMAHPSTPDSIEQTPTRPRAATTSALNQDYPRPATPSTPALSIRSGLGFSTRPKPLYSAIRKNGVCLSPPLPLPSPSYTTSDANSPGCSSGKVNEYGVGNGNGYGSPASSFFPLYPAGETMLLSLSLESRPSSSSTSSSSAHEDAFGPLTMLKAKCGYRSRSKSRSKSKRRKHDSPRSRSVPMSSTPHGGVQSSTGMAGAEPGSVYQRAFQVPAAVGPGTGCSMSGETELKLALARHERPSSSLCRETSPAGWRGAKHPSSAAADVQEPGSPSLKPSGVIRRLREMVSRTF